MAGLKDKTLKHVQFDGNPLVDKNRLMKIMSKSKKPIKDLLDYLRSKTPPAAFESAKEGAKKVNAKAKEGGAREDTENQRGSGLQEAALGDAGKGGGGTKNMKMSKRQAELHLRTMGKNAEVEALGKTAVGLTFCTRV
jgi:hypothetical protein